MPVFATVKVDARFARWLKVEAARRGVSMAYLIKTLAENGLGGAAPWEYAAYEPLPPRKRKPPRGRRKKHRGK